MQTMPIANTKYIYVFLQIFDTAKLDCPPRLARTWAMVISSSKLFFCWAFGVDEVRSKHLFWWAISQLASSLLSRSGMVGNEVFRMLSATLCLFAKGLIWGRVVSVGVYADIIGEATLSSWWSEILRLYGEGGGGYLKVLPSVLGASCWGLWAPLVFWQEIEVGKAR